MTGTWRLSHLLVWFGMLEVHVVVPETHPAIPRSFYRKAPLFDRFLSFDIGSPAPHAPRH